MIYELTRWLSYLRVKHEQMLFYVLWLPLLLSITMTIFLVLFNATEIFLKPDGIIKDILSVLFLLPGFFFAALAAVATFQLPTLDDYIDEDNFQIRLRTNGAINYQPATYRLFLCSLFSYLLGASFIVIMLGLFNRIFREVFTASITLKEFSHYYDIVYAIEIGFIFVFLYILSSIVVTSIHGVYFLSERIHRPPTS